MHGREGLTVMACSVSVERGADRTHPQAFDKRGDRLPKIAVVGVHVATVSHRLKQDEETNVCLQDLALIVREVL